MNQELLIIFPNKRQIEYLKNVIDNDTNVCIVMRQNYDKTAWGSNITIKHADSKEDIAELQKKTYRVLCCHEEALFWARINYGENWEFSFSKKYFSVLNKAAFKKQYMNKVKMAKYSLQWEMVSDFPKIGKPSIGFGSIGVMHLENIEACKWYQERFTEMIGDSKIAKYQEKYFSDMNNCCIFEEYIEGTFFRVPHIVTGGKCECLFPAAGIATLSQRISDYHWNEFEYLGDDVANMKQMKLIIDVMAEDLKLEDGVYIAEFMQRKNGEVFLLEFSPRQTSERIAHIVYLATGIDLELMAIDYFVKRQTTQKMMKNICVRLRMDRGTGEFSPIPEYELIEVWKESNIYKDKIESQFYTKGENTDGKGKQ